MPDAADANTFLRLSLACFCGLLLGMDREMRGKPAGVRTHALVSLSSALITISALMLFETLRDPDGGATVDPLRVIQGLAQAIGFIAAGTIMVARGNVHHLTSAAALWLAAGLGITAGAGQFRLTIMAMGLGLTILVVMRIVERAIPGSGKSD